MEAYKVEEYKGYNIKIYQDDNPENPREWDNLGSMVCNHRRYSIGDKNEIPWNEFHQWKEVEEYIVKKCKAAVVLPIYMLDHSGVTIATTPFSCPWDSGQIGFIYATAETIRQEFEIKRLTPKVKIKALKLLVTEVKVMDDYLRGEIYGFKVDSPTVEDSCWGYYGEQGLIDAVDEAKASVDNYLKEELCAQTFQNVKVMTAP